MQEVHSFIEGTFMDSTGVTRAH